MSQLNVDTIKKADGTGNLTIPATIGTVLTTAGGVLTGDLTLENNGLYLGGTGAANYLEEYEEGTWTPAIASGTISVTHAVYTKIGNTVFVSVRIENPSDTTSSTEVEISGLPFASTSGNASVNALFYRYFTHSSADLVAYKGAGNIVLYQSFSNNQNWVSLKHSSFNTGADFYFSISYQTDA